MERAGAKPGSPIFPVIAYPPATAFVPPQLIILELIAGFLAMIAAGVWRGTVVEPVFAIPTVVALHVFFALRYRADPHIVQVWRARYAGRPVAPFAGARRWPAGRRDRRRIRFGD